MTRLFGKYLCPKIHRIMPTIATQTTTKIACHHCGEDCDEEVLWQADHAFCCQGCRMVFDILNENGLTNFYKIEDRPGLSQKGKKTAQYEWLNDTEIFEQLIDYQDDEIVKVRLFLPQIHCSACIYLLENLYKLDAGLRHSQVNFLKKEIQITYTKTQTNLQKIAELLASIGYPPEINFSDLDKPEKSSTDKTLAYQLGVAGFAFGNIMLLSFPEYLGLEETIFQNLFGYLNILLILPVVFYSGRSYLQSAWQSLRQGHLNIDVPISLGILTLFGRSLFEILTYSDAGYLDSLAGLIFFLLIGKWFQQKTYHHLSFERDYKSYFPIAANLIENGQQKSVPVNQLNIGDHILVRHQELIPADGILKKGRGRLDYSFVTGESEPISKNSGEKIYAGGRQMGEAIEIVLTRKVSQSYLTQLWNEDAFTKKTVSETSELANRIGKYFTFVILTIAFATLLFWLPKDVPLAINAFTAVLIIACPCAVALSIPFTLGNALRLLSKHGFYLKNTAVIEHLNQISVAVFDKTGTLTVTATNDITYEGVALSETEKIAIKSLVQQSTHPISRKIDAYFKNIKKAEILDFEEITGKGIQGFVNSHFIQIIKKEDGKRGTAIYLNGEERGVFILKNHYRNGVRAVMKKLRNLYQLYALSGDNDNERRNLEKLFNRNNIYFEQSPKNKLDFVKRMQTKGEKVLMFGDGLNDAGALKQSHVGIVIAEDTNNFTPACDAILDAKKIDHLPQFISFTQNSIWVVYASYLLAFIYNLIGLSFAVQGTLSPVIAAILMPLSSVTIVSFGVLMTNLLVTKITASG